MVSKGYFTFDGESCADYGIYTAGSGVFNSPTRDVTTDIVPGRNGLLVHDNGRFSNVQVVYTIVVNDDFKHSADLIRAWLLSAVGYKRLEDTWHPDHFRLARFVGSIDWTIGQLLRYGYCDIKFDCMPQLFLKTGEEYIKATKGGTITNPTRFPSRPLIMVEGNGNGVLTIGNYTVELSGIIENVYIDSDTQNIYKGTENYNVNAVLGASGFPILVPGGNMVSWTGGITAVKITGRWWTV